MKTTYQFGSIFFGGLIVDHKHINTGLVRHIGWHDLNGEDAPPPAGVTVADLSGDIGLRPYHLRWLPLFEWGESTADLCYAWMPNSPGAGCEDADGLRRGVVRGVTVPERFRHLIEISDGKRYIDAARVVHSSGRTDVGRNVPHWSRGWQGHAEWNVLYEPISDGTRWLTEMAADREVAHA